MTTAHQGPAPIVAGVDGTEVSCRAVRWAARTAAVHRCPLHLVHAAGIPDLYVGSTVPLTEAFQEQLRMQGWESLHAAQDIAREAGGTDVHARYDTDPPIPVLVRASRTARMVVLGSSGRTGLVGVLVGSTTLALVTHAYCPVVSVRGDYAELPGEDPRPVVVGVDGSPTSERAIDYAFDEASFRGVDLVAVHTWSDSDITALAGVHRHIDWEPVHETAEQVLAERLAGRKERYPDVAVRRVVVRDRPRHELLTWSRQGQLVVVGSRGRGGFTGMLLGSTSQALIHHAQCPVMIVRPEGAAR